MSLLMSDEGLTTDVSGIFDIDAHEMAPSQMWGDTFGAASGEIAAAIQPWLSRGNSDRDHYNPGVVDDTVAATEENVWTIRGTSAPGAFDFDRRLEVMDVMGIAREELMDGVEVGGVATFLGDAARSRVALFI